jgi:hypothetical protein
MAFICNSFQYGEFLAKCFWLWYYICGAIWIFKYVLLLISSQVSSNVNDISLFFIRYYHTFISTLDSYLKGQNFESRLEMAVLICFSHCFPVHNKIKMAKLPLTSNYGYILSCVLLWGSNERKKFSSMFPSMSSSFNIHLHLVQPLCS